MAPPVQIVTWGEAEVEAADLAYQIKQKRKEKTGDERTPWSEFAVLYRQHTHREELVRELTERGIPYSIEGLDVLHTPEVRDLVACLTAAVSPRDAASLFRVAALPQFSIDPHELRAAMRAVGRDELDIREVLGKLAGGPAVLSCVDKAHENVKKDGTRAVDAARFVSRNFSLADSEPRTAFLKFVETWQTKPRSNTSDEPGISVSAAATSPPVQDSAVATRNPLARAASRRSLAFTYIVF